jgi:hypothetical protein
MTDETTILRKLAMEYYELSQLPCNTEKRRLHFAVNDLKMIRPVVLIEELPWNEMNINDELKLRCTDSYLCEIEWFFRTTIFKFRHFPADMYVRPYLSVSKCIHSTDIGISVRQDTLSTDASNHIVSHEYFDQLGTEEDLLKLHEPIITYDREETMRRYNLLGELLGDILPVKLTGIEYFGSSSWDYIAMLRGVTNLLIDLSERPEFMHKIVGKFTDFALSSLRQYEDLGLFESDPAYDLHCTPILTHDLPQKDYDGTRKLTRKDIWGRGAAQIFAAVSREMHEEFDIEYMKKTIGTCGLVYYGCCEPLDKKIDIIEKLPNLRKISITPWADVNVAAEKINRRYVLANKPNPAAVAVPVLDQDTLKKELTTIINACRRNGCNFELVLKDISTCHGRPQNIFEWEKIAMEMVQNT